jgi:hypothetical protein
MQCEKVLSLGGSETRPHLATRLPAIRLSTQNNVARGRLLRIRRGRRDVAGIW